MKLVQTKFKSHIGEIKNQNAKEEARDRQVENLFEQLVILMKQAQIEDLPKFAGNVKKWPLFLAVYNRTTQVASIDDVLNVGRLTKALEGEARALVIDRLTFVLSSRGISKTLKRRYGREDEMIKTLEFKTFVAQLKSLGMSSELKNNLQIRKH